MRQLFVLSLVLVCVAGLTGVASADAVTFQFNDRVNSFSSSVWWSDGANGGSNTGMDCGIVWLSPTTHDWWFPAACFWANLPANLSGATIDCATLTVWERWGNSLTDVQLRRIDSPVMWVPGSGAKNDRWGPLDNGIQRLFANYNTASGTGVNWAGSTVDWATGTAALTRTEFDTVLGAVIDTENIGIGYSVFNAKSLVQNWANGSWSNKGFCLWMGDWTNTTTEVDTIRSGAGLYIQYTAAIPEPATMLLVGTGLVGLLGVLRRRRMR